MATAVNIPKAIEQLQLDHRNMTRLLGLMRSELEASRAGDTLDFDLLGSVMEYALHYPDLCHHPKEDLIYRRMLLRDPTVGARVGDLLKEHAHLGELTRQFAAALRNREHDVEMPRAWFDNLMENFITANERHIAGEDRTFIPLALVTLSDADWDEIDATVTATPDPLFGGQLAAGFRRLHDRIMRLAV
jgi:hemerythrin-like domain-containing protein